MDIQPGNGLMLQIPYADGAPGNYPRPFLVIGTSEENKEITLLNVSSVKGKETKLLMESNELLKKFNPPFMRPSFVKVDALYKVEYCAELENKKLMNGAFYDISELENVINSHQIYKEAYPHKFCSTEIPIEEIENINVG